jgi:triphosphatase
MTLGAAARIVFRDCLDHLSANEVGARGTKAGGIHQMRAAVRRLRAALKLFKNFFAERERAQLDRELKWLARKLGHARDCDVLANTTTFEIGYSHPRLAAGIAAAVAPIRIARQHDAVHAIHSLRYRQLVRAMRTLIAVQNRSAEIRARLDMPLATYAPAYLDRWWRNTRVAGRGITRHDAARRHTLRKRLREFRYGVDFLSGAYGSARVKRFTQRLVKVQDILGAMNDLATGERLVAEINSAALGNHQKADARRYFHSETRRLQKKFVQAWRHYKATPSFWG